MIKSITAKGRKLKRNLTSLDDQPLGKAALIVILFLDVFILISIFDGLADHAGQLTTPAQYVPQHCRDIVIDADWNQTNWLGQIARIVTKYRGSYYVRDERERTREQHVICQPFARVFRLIKDDDGLAKNLAETLRIQKESNELRSELERIRGVYDTSLLETIARQRHGPANVESIKKEIANKTNALNELVQKLKLLESSLEQDNNLRELFALVAAVSDTDRNRLRDDLRQLNFWYPVKRLGMEMIFLLPLFLVFYFWNSRSIAKNRPFQTLVSSHLVVVVFIPVFFKIVELIYDIIPKKLLKHIIELLESLKLVALWHYLLMGIAIVAALALIYLFQKKLFSREKLIERRIAKGLCQSCNRHLPPDCRACPFCGSGQYRTCSHCHKPTHIHGKYCIECGQTE
jgi:hypothetical protein